MLVNTMCPTTIAFPCVHNVRRSIAAVAQRVEKKETTDPPLRFLTKMPLTVRPIERDDKI